ncbi:MAG: hypothetical protein VSS75_030845 [Candidatus Parabeggiatoa sp.]|nr:hypothetical protein [Candidatus Parabeggiatoa sp.]
MLQYLKKVCVFRVDRFLKTVNSRSCHHQDVVLLVYRPVIRCTHFIIQPFIANAP